MFSSRLKAVLKPVSFAQTFSKSANALDRPIRREDLVHPDHVKMATEKDTMFVYAEPSGNVELKEVPIPDQIKESGVIPEGYTVDFIASPERVIFALERAGVTTIEQLPEETFHEIRATLNQPSNLSIVPTPIYQLKRAAEEKSHHEIQQKK
ncbi:hypothetical protein GYMLUDRAFT_259476 [Collybiopsis luxurians FD-317 M1]|uniref:Uncharacterized protein n=1 Tax=Collybiopsis luxurians FD-317 M1 TaxID=944289 RepID=A0A0D0CLD8_9AGAR|nr:hypothetical protein GYMLUDRAFT_259476 [Collybiopsis luxurians FD-317 M1]